MDGSYYVVFIMLAEPLNGKLHTDYGYSTTCGVSTHLSTRYSNTSTYFTP
jgi:hypothetical protein